MNEETKNSNKESLNRIYEEPKEIQIHSITLDLPDFEGLVIIGWSFSNKKYQKYLTEVGFNENVKNMNQEMESTS